MFENLKTIKINQVGPLTTLTGKPVPKQHRCQNGNVQTPEIPRLHPKWRPQMPTTRARELMAEAVRLGVAEVTDAARLRELNATLLQEYCDHWPAMTIEARKRARRTIENLKGERIHAPH